MTDSYLVVGLGNPDKKYENNRHNVGYHVIGELLARAGARLTRHKSGAYACDVRLGTLPGGAPGPRTILALPGSFMNTSGRATAALAAFHGIDPDHLLVVHDELDLEPHTLRLKLGGGEGSHNGLKSITQHLGTRDYARLRVGIGRPPGRMDPADYVLRDFPAKEREDWAITVADAADAVTDVIATGFSAAQMRLHTT